jgi:hypothetical protein
MATDKIKANDTRQQLTATLELDGSAVNLSGCTILCLLKLNESPFTAYSIAAEIVSAAAGTVKCLASTSGFPTVAGTYKQEWQVTFGDATVLTFPSNSYNELKILDDLN